MVSELVVRLSHRVVPRVNFRRIVLEGSLRVEEPDTDRRSMLKELTDFRTGSGSDRILALTEVRGISYLKPQIKIEYQILYFSVVLCGGLF
jgi:hypothetical protein